jgi:hypothetical protein
MRTRAALAAVLAASLLLAAGCGGSDGPNPAEKYIKGRSYTNVGLGDGLVSAATCTNSEGNRYQCQLTLVSESEFKGKKIGDGLVEVICDDKSCQDSGELKITTRVDPMSGKSCGSDAAPAGAPADCVWWSS